MRLIQRKRYRKTKIIRINVKNIRKRFNRDFPLDLYPEQQAHQVVRQHHCIERRFGRPKILHIETVGGEIVFEFFDSVVAVRAAAIQAPDRFVG